MPKLRFACADGSEKEVDNYGEVWLYDFDGIATEWCDSRERFMNCTSAGCFYGNPFSNGERICNQ
jgi:hypothetical protein